jgi:hypothetical protein
MRFLCRHGRTPFNNITNSIERNVSAVNKTFLKEIFYIKKIHLDGKSDKKCRKTKYENANKIVKLFLR